MLPDRIVPVFDQRADPQSWSNRMKRGESAAMLTDARSGSPCDEAGMPVMDVNRAPCYIFSDLASANAWCVALVQAMPEIRCRVYDADGLAKPPAAEHSAPQYVRRDPLNRKVSRRAGIGLLAAGLLLCLIEWLSGFRLSWAAMLGMRLWPAGLVLLVAEAAFLAEDARKRRKARQAAANGNKDATG